MANITVCDKCRENEFLYSVEKGVHHISTKVKISDSIIGIMNFEDQDGRLLDLCESCRLQLIFDLYDTWLRQRREAHEAKKAEMEAKEVTS